MESSHSHGAGHGIIAVAIASILMAIGVIMVLSAGAGLDQPLIHRGSGVMLALRQLGAGVIGFGIMMTLMHVPHHAYRWRAGSVFQPALLLVLIACAFLLSVYVPGVGIERNGARRWVDLRVLSFQPSELAKLALIFFLAAWFSDPNRAARDFRSGLLPAVAVPAVLVGLVGLEDFGTAALLTCLGGAMLVAAGCRWWHLGVLAVPSVAALSAMVIHKPYRLERIMSFRDIWADPQGSGYHAVQSLCTIASGGWFGRGLGGGIQKYGYLPQARNDFIFAVICEEVGVLGGMVVIALLVGLLWQGRHAMRTSPDRLGRLLACGITMLIGLQAAMNIAVVTVMVPTKGIALPLVSAGGTGIFVFCACIGILAGISRSAPAPVPIGTYRAGAGQAVQRIASRS